MSDSPVSLAGNGGLNRRERISLFLSGVMNQAASIALRHPTDSKIATRERLMTSRIPGMIEELEELLANNPLQEPNV